MSAPLPEVTSLRHQLRHLEQENDDLESRVRRLRATEATLKHQLEKAEEKAIFSQHELEMVQEEHERNATRSQQHIAALTSRLQGYEDVINRLLIVMDLPPLTQAPIAKRNLSAVPLDDAMSGQKKDDDPIVATLRKMLQCTQHTYQEYIHASSQVENALQTTHPPLQEHF